jgi:spore coat polysaccharide biosynthesis protein SpsF
MDDSIKPRIGAIVQARMGSSRLPGKVLLPLPLGGPHSVLHHVLSRAHRATLVDEVVVATTTLPADDAVAAAAAAAGALVFRGNKQDVLRRFQEAAAAFSLDVIVRLTADNPAIDPLYLDQALHHHLSTGADYTFTTGLPLGTNLEIISRAALAAANTRATQPEEREHVTPYLRRHPEQFRLETPAFTAESAPANTRLTLDYASDYALLQLLFTSLPPQFGLLEIGQLLRQHPWLADINKQNTQIRV